MAPVFTFTAKKEKKKKKKKKKKRDLHHLFVETYKQNGHFSRLIEQSHLAALWASSSLAA